MISTRLDRAADESLHRRDRPTARRVAPALASDVSAALADMRMSSYASAVRRAGEPFAVVVYALTTAGRVPSTSLDRAEQYARARGWRVVQSIYDDCGMTEPTERPGWREVLSLVRSASAQGVVTVDSSAISAAAKEYESELRWLIEHVSFLAHVPGDWTTP